MVTFSHITNAFTKTFYRFPLALISAWLGMVVSWILVDTSSQSQTVLYNLLMTSVLGFLLFMTLSLFLERRKKNPFSIWLTFAGLAFLVVYYLLLPDNFDYASSAFMVRFILFTVTLLFSITFAPFVKKDEINGFWQHNKALFIRLFFTVVYMGIFYLGLVLAMASSDYLLGIRFEGEDYLRVWIVVLGFLCTAFFLSGVPEKTAALEKKKDYPKGIKVFSQYILSPLLALYAVILYAYLAKILITSQWPEGTVSYLILAFASVGVFTYFLLYPSQKESSWAHWFSRLFYATLIPLIFMLFTAIWIRVAEYGLTERRYYVIILGVWLLCISLYFLFSKKKSLKLISISLFIITLLSSFGPWGAISLSEASQFNRLENVLVKNNLLVDGKVVEATEEISFEDRGVVSGTLDYLYEFHGTQKIQPWFDQDIIAPKDAGDCYGASCLMSKMGLVYISAWDRKQYNEEGIYPRIGAYYSSDKTPFPLIPVSGYDYSVQINIGSYNEEGQTVEVGETSYRFTLSGTNVDIYKNEALLNTIDIQTMKDLIEGTSFDFGDLVLENESLKFMFLSISDVQFSDEGEWESVGWVDAVLLIRE